MQSLSRAHASGSSTPGADANTANSISCGDPQRNKNYRVAVFGSQKSDPVEATPGGGAKILRMVWPTDPLAAADAHEFVPNASEYRHTRTGSVEPLRPAREVPSY